LDPSKQLIVLSRDSFELHVSSSELETIISDYNKGAKHVSMIRVYVIDYQGIVTKSKSRSIRKVVAKNIKDDVLEQKRIEKQKRDNQQREEKKDRQNRRKLAQLNRKERFNKWWLIVKTKLQKKQKSGS
jgi:selenocysteine-specific translation elongation factor